MWWLSEPFLKFFHMTASFPCGTAMKNLPANARDAGWVPGLGRSLGVGNGNPLQYSYLGDPRDHGAGWATVHGVSKSVQDPAGQQQRMAAFTRDQLPATCVPLKAVPWAAQPRGTSWHSPGDLNSDLEFTLAVKDEKREYSVCVCVCVCARACTCMHTCAHTYMYNNHETMGPREESGW